MNGRTARLLKQVARKRRRAGDTEVTERRVKRWWLSLRRDERARARKGLLAEISESAEAAK